jgi:lysophospholipase L1-like esterase
MIQPTRSRHRFHHASVAFVIGGLIAAIGTDTASADDIVITSPRPHQVVQRLGYVPQSADDADGEAVAEKRLGSAWVTVAGSLPEGTVESELTYTVTEIDARGEGRDETSSPSASIPLAASNLRGNEFRFRILVPAGGWYRLEITGRTAANDPITGQAGPFGVGEVFVVAGQSYATNTNDEHLVVTDPRRRVVALDVATGAWQVANDPQPAPDRTDGGSIWPPVGDALVAQWGVPIAFANVAYGGTSSFQWLPEEGLHAGLRAAGVSLGRFRGVLWQQGESDVILKTPADQYVANLQAIRRAAVRAWGFEPVWLLAKSTHHPTVYNDPDGEAVIRGAIERLSGMPGFAAGPDTDSLQGENRGDANSRRHFSGIGQRRAAELWAQTLRDRVDRLPSGVEAASFLLADLGLRQPAWRSEIVVRESSVLLQSDQGDRATARLAFPAAEILEVVAADLSGQPEYALGDDQIVRFEALSGENASGADDPLAGNHPPEFIAQQDFFPPKGSPNSYAHRAGMPEQNLLYRPGNWFHHRNVEITYRRDLARGPLDDSEVVFGELPKTLQRLRAGEPVTVGISGDSISTGLDASMTTAAPPLQPGYPDLVVAQLRADFDSDVSLRNRAVSGWSVANGVADLDALLAERPHLVVVAYGMNDVGRRDAAWFVDQTRAIIDRVQAHNADTEILLVAPMLGHQEWVHTPREQFASYRDGLKSLVGPGVALADVTAVWDTLLRRKHDFDLTGNGLNHPNDFGHRVYAQAILELLK